MEEKLLVGIEGYKKRSINEDCKYTQTAPKTLNIYLDLLSLIPDDVIKANDLEKDVFTKEYIFCVESLDYEGDWGLFLGNFLGENSKGIECKYSIQSRFGYVWGSISNFNGIEYFAQHADVQYHATDGWRIRVKFELLNKDLESYRSDDGKRLIFE